jgi:hypothetical protein
VLASKLCCGYASVEQVRSKAESVEINSSGIRESQVHEVQITYQAQADRTDEGLSIDKKTTLLINELQEGIFAGQMSAADQRQVTALRAYNTHNIFTVLSILLDSKL